MAKVSTYTDHEAEIARSMYSGVLSESDERRMEVVREIARILEKPQSSVIGKLVRDDIYIKATPKSKVTGGKVIKKEALVDEFQREFNVFVPSMGKMTKVDILTIYKIINGFRAQAELSDNSDNTDNSE